MTVDTFLEQKESPKLIRMDVEGYEYEIIKGMPQTLKKDVKILVELHPSQKLDDLLQILKQNNFKVRFVVFEGRFEENKISKLFTNKVKGTKDLPFVASNLSLEELKDICKNPISSPNVLFEKQSTRATISYNSMVD